MRFAELAAVSAAVAGTSARNAKIELLAGALRGLAPDEIEAGTAYLSGELRQRQTGVGWSTLKELPPPAPVATLSVGEVDRAVAEIAAVAGSGSLARRRELVRRLFAAATAEEQHMLRGLFLGELRQGAGAGVLTEAVARAATAEEALVTTGTPALADTKLDGVRIQVHRDGDQVAVFSRSLDVLTDRMPEVVAAVRQLPASRMVLDGEAIALDPTGRPRPFQETAAIAAERQRDTSGTPRLSPYFFDVLHLDGADLLDAPLSERIEALAGAIPDHLLVARRTVAEVPELAAALTAAVSDGQEGVVVKSLTAPYDAGRRGGAWVKLKPRHTLDLVVLAAEWGHGRRSGWLSNLHLGARDPRTGGFVMLGKTFKGLTDELLRWQTRRFQELAIERNEWLVRVRPEQVVEIAFDGVQASPRYPGGVALRFARVLRYRHDKTAAEADTIDAVRAIHAQRAASERA